MYSRYPDGRYFNPIADPNSPQFDKSLSDLNIKANQKGSPGLIVGSSGLVTSFQSLKDAEDRLLAKGVDLVKLEQEEQLFLAFAYSFQKYPLVYIFNRVNKVVKI